MHEHNEDVILDLLDDPGVSWSEISARLDGCVQCTADLTEQKAIASSLADLERPALDGTERAALRSAVFEAIEPAAVIPLARQRSWDWTRLGTVAAALVGVVAVAGLFSVLGGGADDAGDGSDTATVAAESDADRAALSLEAAPAAADAADDAGATESMEESFGDAASIPAPSKLVRDLGSVDIDGFTAGLNELRSSVANVTESSPVLQRDADEVGVSCLGELEDRGAIRAIAVAVVDGLDVEVYLDNAGGEYAYASVDCSPYDLPG